MDISQRNRVSSSRVKIHRPSLRRIGRLGKERGRAVHLHAGIEPSPVPTGQLCSGRSPAAPGVPWSVCWTRRTGLGGGSCGRLIIVVFLNWTQHPNPTALLRATIRQGRSAVRCCFIRLSLIEFEVEKLLQNKFYFFLLFQTPGDFKIYWW